MASHGGSFSHTEDIKLGRASGVHQSLDPLNLRVRESRDSDAHPESNAIVVWLDVTGSMSRVVRQIHASLPRLMNMLTGRNLIDHPQILFGAVGDATQGDRGPLQIGQFESGAEMEGDLGNFWLENGGGGGIPQESYELAAFATARHTSIDCFERRNRKGYVFFIGDEMTYPFVSKMQVKELLGEDISENVPTTQIFNELKDMYNVFFILPTDGAHGREEGISNYWHTLVGADHILRLEDPSNAADLIAAQIGVCEGRTTIEALREGEMAVASSVLSCVSCDLATISGPVADNL